jgi:hypothetical protein
MVAMQNVTVSLPNEAGALARLGEALGGAGVSLEGGGVFAVANEAIANFLVADGAAAAAALARAGFAVRAVREVLVRRLKQDEPGQLGRIARRLAEAGVNVEVQYSDHENRLILVVDDLATAAAATLDWRADGRVMVGAG